MLNNFPQAICYLYILSWDTSVELWPFVFYIVHFLAVEFRRLLCFLDASCFFFFLSETWFVNSFLAVNSLSFYSCKSVFYKTKVVSSSEVQFIIFFFFRSYFWCHSEEQFDRAQFMKTFFFVFLLKFYIFSFALRSVTIVLLLWFQLWSFK